MSIAPTPTHSPPTRGPDGSRPRCLLATTRLAPDATAAAVADIFKRCRDRHQQLAITGTMLFDGERFGHLLCGAAVDVGAAFDAVATDPRQALPVVLADGPDMPSWTGRGWRSGWSEPDALADLTAPDAPRDAKALQAWRELVAASDLL